jgi:hypothetical protein
MVEGLDEDVRHSFRQPVLICKIDPDPAVSRDDNKGRSRGERNISRRGYRERGCPLRDWAYLILGAEREDPIPSWYGGGSVPHSIRLRGTAHIDPVEFAVEGESSHLFPDVNDPAWRCSWENVRPDFAPHFKPENNLVRAGCLIVQTPSPVRDGRKGVFVKREVPEMVELSPE